MPSIGSLCTGYGGLDLAVEHLTGGRTVWVSDVDSTRNAHLKALGNGVVPQQAVLALQLLGLSHDS